MQNIFTRVHKINKQAKVNNHNQNYLDKIQEILRLSSKCDVIVKKEKKQYSIIMTYKDITHRFHLPFRFSNIINQLICK